MKPLSNPIRGLTSLLFVLVLFVTHTAYAQVDVECEAPRIREWDGEAKLTMEFGKQQCEEAEELAKRATKLREESEWFKENGESEKEKAKELREQHEYRLRDAEKRKEEAAEVIGRRKDHEKDLDDNIKFLERRNKNLSDDITFQVQDSVSIAKPMVNGLDWQKGQDNALGSFDAYEESIMALLETDEMAVDSMGTLLEIEGNSILTRAELHDRRAQQHFAAAAATIKVAEQMEGAALVSERAATMHNVKATLLFVSRNSNEDGRRMKRDLERGISYIESNLDKLPSDVAIFAQYQIARAQDAMR